MWLYATGALAAMATQNKDFTSYYQTLLESYDRTFPNPNFKQIKVDLPRTFADEELYQNPMVLQAIENILVAYSVRNPTIGYCQGFNFIVGRLIQVVNEEIKQEAFWMFCQIIETIMPLDYYSNMVGALIDQKVLDGIFRERFPDLHNHLSSLNCDLSFITFQWFTCFFSYNVPFTSLERIWDLFFLKGSKILFRFSLVIISFMKKSLLETTDFQQIFKVMEQFPQELYNPERLIQYSNMKKFKISNKEIMEKRDLLRESVLSSIQDYQQELSTNLLNCDKHWPVCLFDFTYKNKVPEFFIFRVDKTRFSLHEDYFYGDQNQSNGQSQMPVSFEKSSDSQEENCKVEEESEQDIFSPPNLKHGPPADKIAIEEVYSEKDLMIERNNHYCSKKSIINFKRLLKKNDCQMYTSDFLNFDIDNEIEAQQKISKFVNQLELIVQNIDKIQSLIKCLKRSNSEYLEFRPQSRMRNQSNDEDEKQKSRQIQKQSSQTPYQSQFRNRTKSGKFEDRRNMRHHEFIQNYKGDAGNLKICTLAYLFRDFNRTQLEKLFKEMRANKQKGPMILQTMLIDLFEEDTEKSPSSQKLSLTQTPNKKIE